MPLFGPAPEDEADVDREIRIEKIKRELEDLSGGSMTAAISERPRQASKRLF